MPEEKVSPSLCTECGHSESAHFSAEMGSFCKFCPTENNVWEHVFGKPPAADAGPRPRTRHEFNQGTGFCEICGGHNTHVRSEYCLPPPKRVAAPPVPQEASETLKQMTVNNLPQGAVGVPQEAAPVCPMCAKPIFADGTMAATAPDWAMRVARECVSVVHQQFGFNCDDPTCKKCEFIVASLIRQAGSERERELREALRDVQIHAFAIPPLLRAKVERLLGGELK